jgi:hypothetical protein
MPSKEEPPGGLGFDPGGDRGIDPEAPRGFVGIDQEDTMAHEAQLNPSLPKHGTIFDRLVDPFRRVADRLTGGTPEASQRSQEIVFEGFRASPEPAGPVPDCLACGSPLMWKPTPYSFGQEGVLFVVREMGGWRCSQGHPGKVYRPDFVRYVELVEAYLATNPNN